MKRLGLIAAADSVEHSQLVWLLKVKTAMGFPTVDNSWTENATDSSVAGEQTSPSFLQ